MADWPDERPYAITFYYDAPSELFFICDEDGGPLLQVAREIFENLLTFFPRSQ